MAFLELDTGDRDRDLDDLDRSFRRFSDSIDEERTRFLVDRECERVWLFVDVTDSLSLEEEDELHSLELELEKSVERDMIKKC